MSLTLKILLLLDAFFALALAVYLFIKYRKKFKKRPEIIRNESGKEETEVEVTYEEEKVKVSQCEVSIKEEALKKAEEDKLNIGSYDDLETFIKEKSEEKK